MQTSTSDSTSSSLLARVKRQDAAAWTRLAEVYSPLVYSWCRQFGVRAQDSSDIVQEVFRAVHRSINQFDHRGSGTSFCGWLWVVTRNSIRDHFRAEADRDKAPGGSEARQRLAELPDREPLSPASEHRSPSWLVEGLQGVREEFEENTWWAFWRSVVDGADTADVAEELRITPNAVRIARSRILRRLREELEGMLD